MKRKQSLRELRCKKPANVLILPGAAPKQVRQSTNRAGSEARKTLREAQKQKFPYKHPHVREAEKLASAISEVDGNPGVILAHAVLAQLDREVRWRVVEALQEACVLLPSSRGHFQAYAVARTTVQTYGEHVDLERALRMLREQK